MQHKIKSFKMFPDVHSSPLSDDVLGNDTLGLSPTQSKS